ncbi:MAG: preprotein translocase subunit SecE [Bacilli bacterium]|nr:preprotein translocase subunit SecE [Bacilli bacterium]
MGAKKYVKEVIKEGKRVRWPKKERFFPVFISVLIICVVTALILMLEDLAAGTLRDRLTELFQSGSSSSGEETSSALAVIKSLIRR